MMIDVRDDGGCHRGMLTKAKEWTDQLSARSDTKSAKSPLRSDNCGVWGVPRNVQVT
jgi:hypothetical protein